MRKNDDSMSTERQRKPSHACASVGDDVLAKVKLDFYIS